jgi:predicted ATP-grasp superfamily ATP-dependent carboligase
MPITFTKTSLPFGWLGNMAPYPIEYLEKTWRTAEALFQALRFVHEDGRWYENTPHIIDIWPQYWSSPFQNHGDHFSWWQTKFAKDKPKFVNE